MELEWCEWLAWVEWCEWYSSTALQHKQSNYDLSWTITTQAEQ
jgi:hypothetical protein